MSGSLKLLKVAIMLKPAGCLQGTIGPFHLTRSGRDLALHQVVREIGGEAGSPIATKEEMQAIRPTVEDISARVAPSDLMPEGNAVFMRAGLLPRTLVEALPLNKRGLPACSWVIFLPLVALVAEQGYKGREFYEVAGFDISMCGVQVPAINAFLALVTHGRQGLLREINGIMFINTGMVDLCAQPPVQWVETATSLLDNIAADQKRWKQTSLLI